MTKNLKTADAIVKLTLAVLVIVSYLSQVISGPFARVLVALAVLVVLIFVLRICLAFIIRD